MQNEYEKAIISEEEGCLMVGITPHNITDAIAYIKENKVDGIYFDTSGDFNTYEFLKDINVAEMSTYTSNVKLNDFPIMESIKTMYCQENKNLIDFNLFPNLAECTMKWSDKIHGDSSSLRKLTIWNFNPKQNGISNLNIFPNLENLEINFSNLENLNGVSFFENLKSLSLCYASKMKSISEIAELGNIESLHIDHMKKIEDYSFIECLSKLKQLIITDCAPIKDLSFLNNLKQLISFHFVNTNIISGDLSPCINIESIGFFPHKRHYSHTLEELTNKRV